MPLRPSKTLILFIFMQILEELDEKEKESLHRLEGCTWHPEYGNWMVEATPRRPFSGYAADLVRVSESCTAVWPDRKRSSACLSLKSPLCEGPVHNVCFHFIQRKKTPQVTVQLDEAQNIVVLYHVVVRGGEGWGMAS